MLFPRDHVPGSGRLPVAHVAVRRPARTARSSPASAASARRSGWPTRASSWSIADGRGTPGRGPRWERAIAGDLATLPLEDQVDALHAVAAGAPATSTSTRVGIRGWSFGGYLAALAVLRRPDVFHAAVAGAPVTDWRLYDTAYTERYLGHPDEAPGGVRPQLAARRRRRRPDAARCCSSTALADDNVVVAHTLRCPARCSRPVARTRCIPLSGVTHMTPDEVVAENKLRLELDFLRTHLQP